MIFEIYMMAVYKDKLLIVYMKVFIPMDRNCIA